MVLYNGSGATEREWGYSGDGGWSPSSVLLG